MGVSTRTVVFLSRGLLTKRCKTGSMKAAVFPLPRRGEKLFFLYFQVKIMAAEEDRTSCKSSCFTGRTSLSSRNNVSSLNSSGQRAVLDIRGRCVSHVRDGLEQAWLEAKGSKAVR